VAQPYEDDLPPLAPFERLVKRLGYTPEGGEADRANDILAAVSDEIRDVGGKTWADVAGDLVGVPTAVQSVCVSAAYRAFTNPEGLSQRTIGDSSKAWDRASREGGDIVYLTEREEERIRRAAGSTSMVSVTLVSPYSYPVSSSWDYL
jgi:hypothetical protein